VVKSEFFYRHVLEKKRIEAPKVKEKERSWKRAAVKESGRAKAGASGWRARGTGNVY